MPHAPKKQNWQICSQRALFFHSITPTLPLSRRTLRARALAHGRDLDTARAARPWCGCWSSFTRSELVSSVHLLRNRNPPRINVTESSCARDIHNGVTAPASQVCEGVGSVSHCSFQINHRTSCKTKSSNPHPNRHTEALPRSCKRLLPAFPQFTQRAVLSILLRHRWLLSVAFLCRVAPKTTTRLNKEDGAQSALHTAERCERGVPNSHRPIRHVLFQGTRGSIVCASVETPT